MPEQVVDGKAQLAIVRHELGCPTLLAQTRVRWSDEDDDEIGRRRWSRRT